MNLNKKIMNPNMKGRKFFSTVNIGNFENLSLTESEYKDTKYLATYLKNIIEDSGKNREAAVVVCLSENNLYHAHVFVACENPTTIRCISDILGKAHTEIVHDVKLICSYMNKTDGFEEKGEMILEKLGMELLEEKNVKQGNKKDIEVIEELINQGKTPDEIYEVNFKFRRYEKLILSAFNSRMKRITPLIKDMKVVYHFGNSGTGKTFSFYRLCEIYGNEAVYLANDYEAMGMSTFDSYCSERIVCLDEVTPLSFKYKTLLNLMDVYSRNQVHARYYNKYLLFSELHLFSLYSPEELYLEMITPDKRKKEPYIQMKRRITEVVYHYVNDDGKYKQFSMKMVDYKSRDDMVKLAMLNEQYEIEEERLLRQSENDELFAEIEKELLKKYDKVE